jgi:hypothetical protein
MLVCFEISSPVGWNARPFYVDILADMNIGFARNQATDFYYVSGNS